jgi:hypothetical protein
MNKIIDIFDDGIPEHFVVMDIPVEFIEKGVNYLVKYYQLNAQLGWFIKTNGKLSAWFCIEVDLIDNAVKSGFDYLFFKENDGISSEAKKETEVETAEKS